MKKSKRIVIDDQEDGDDRLSELPNELVAQILCLLSPVEAARTCTLSKRWKNMFIDAWTSRMNFNISYNSWQRSRCLKYEKSLAKYVECVNRQLGHHRAPNIDQFSVCFCLDVGVGVVRSQIFKWIEFAMKKNVKMLRLGLYCFSGFISDRRRYRFPKKLLSLEHLGFKSLQVLEFRNVDVTGKVLENMLSHSCPALERLVVVESESLVNFRVVGTPSLMLKHLEIQDCMRLKHIEVRDCMNLVMFVVTGIRKCDILLKNVPKLVKVFVISLSPSYRISSALNHLSCCLSQLEFLKLSANSVNVAGEDDSENAVFPLLTNLKHLELEVNAPDCYVLQQLNSLLIASPNLQRIVLKLNQFDRTWNTYAEAAKYWPHHNLKEVKLLRFNSSTSRSYIQFVEFFIEYAVALEKIIIESHISDKENMIIIQAIEQLRKTKFSTSHVQIACYTTPLKFSFY